MGQHDTDVSDHVVLAGADAGEIRVGGGAEHASQHQDGHGREADQADQHGVLPQEQAQLGGGDAGGGSKGPASRDVDTRDVVDGGRGGHGSYLLGECHEAVFERRAFDGQVLRRAPCGHQAGPDVGQDRSGPGYVDL